MDPCEEIGKLTHKTIKLKATVAGRILPKDAHCESLAASTLFIEMANVK